MARAGSKNNDSFKRVKTVKRNGFVQNATMGNVKWSRRELAQATEPDPGWVLTVRVVRPIAWKTMSRIAQELNCEMLLGVESA